MSMAQLDVTFTSCDGRYTPLRRRSATQPLELVATTMRPIGRRLSIPRLQVTFGRRSGRLALATLLLASFAVVVFSTGHATSLVPRSNAGFPGWEAGPLHSLFGHITGSYRALQYGFSAVLIVMAAAYGIVPRPWAAALDDILDRLIGPSNTTTETRA